MNQKERLKKNIDHLNQQELQIIQLMIDNLLGKKRRIRTNKQGDNKAYLKVIEALGNNELGSEEIIQLRSDRI